MLNELIKQIPDESALLELLKRFDNLLKKYARLLKYEDAYEDMRLFLIELLYRMKENEFGAKNDGYIVKYITISVKNRFISISKTRKTLKIVPFADISDEQMIYVEQFAARDDKNDISVFYPRNGKLTAREEIILDMYFTKEYTIEEIASYLGISRQAANQAKNRALNKIRNSFFQ